MVEWNGIFRLFRFSGILGQPREAHQNFGIKFRKMSVPLASLPFGQGSRVEGNLSRVEGN